MSKKGKSRTRPARRDFMKSNASANSRHKAREQARAKGYDRQKYDSSNAEEA